MASDPHDKTEPYNLLFDRAKRHGLRVGLLVTEALVSRTRGREQRGLLAITLYDDGGRRVDHELIDEAGRHGLQVAAGRLLGRLVARAT